MHFEPNEWDRGINTMKFDDHIREAIKYARSKELKIIRRERARLCTEALEIAANGLNNA